MEFTVSKSNLQKGLEGVQGAVERRGSIPILGNVLLKAGQDNLEITATDLDVTIVGQCEISANVPGVATVSAKRLMDIVRLLPDGEISIQLQENDWLGVKSNGSSYKMVGLPADNFPMVERLTKQVAVIPGEVLSALIRRVSYAITQEESRYSLSGALMKLEPGRITMVATDGHRLSMASAEIALDCEKQQVLIPRKGLQELLKMCIGSVRFDASESHLFFSAGGRYLTARRLAGQFPNYDLVLPKDNDKLAIINRETLANAIRRVSVMSSEKMHGISLVFTPTRLELSASSSDAGEAHEYVEYKGEGLAGLDIKINPNYLMDFLSECHTTEVSLSLKDEEAAVDMRPVGLDGYQCIVMPMKF